MEEMESTFMAPGFLRSLPVPCLKVRSTQLSFLLDMDDWKKIEEGYLNGLIDLIFVLMENIMLDWKSNKLVDRQRVSGRRNGKEMIIHIVLHIIFT